MGLTAPSLGMTSGFGTLASDLGLETGAEGARK